MFFHWQFRNLYFYQVDVYCFFSLYSCFDKFVQLFYQMTGYLMLLKIFLIWYFLILTFIFNLQYFFLLLFLCFLPVFPFSFHSFWLTLILFIRIVFNSRVFHTFRLLLFSKLFHSYIHFQSFYLNLILETKEAFMRFEAFILTNFDLNFCVIFYFSLILFDFSIKDFKYL